MYEKNEGQVTELSNEEMANVQGGLRSGGPDGVDFVSRIVARPQGPQWVPGTSGLGQEGEE